MATVDNKTNNAQSGVDTETPPVIAEAEKPNVVKDGETEKLKAGPYHWLGTNDHWTTIGGQSVYFTPGVTIDIKSPDFIIQDFLNQGLIAYGPYKEPEKKK